MSKKKEAWAELVSSLWDCGFAYGLEGATDAKMVLELGAELGEPLPKWMLPTLYAGRVACEAEKDREAAELPADAGNGTDAIPL